MKIPYTRVFPGELQAARMADDIRATMGFDTDFNFPREKNKETVVATYHGYWRDRLKIGTIGDVVMHSHTIADIVRYHKLKETARKIGYNAENFTYTYELKLT